MTWKSYTAVSGATVLAGWLASSPPSNTPPSAGVSRAPSPRRAATTATDIQHQASRLQSRVRTARAYAQPQRNPFRFVARTELPPEPGARTGAGEQPAEPIDLAPAGPRVSVSGIAEEQVEGRVERTAILSSPMGVLLVREGEDVLGYYRVTRIESEAVELEAIADGTTRRLTFGTSQAQ